MRGAAEELSLGKNSDWYVALTDSYKILIADDHDLFRDGLVLIIQGHLPSSVIVTAPNLSIAKTHLSGNEVFDLALIDLDMPGMGSVDKITILREAYPITKFAIVSGRTEKQTIERALALGAAGYIPKNSPSEIVVKAIDIILAGVAYVPPHILVAATPHAAHHDLHDGASSMEPAPSELPRIEGLTRRQVEILGLIVRGLTNAQIAHEAGISEGTVRIHVSAILRALNVQTRTRAAFVASQYFPGIDPTSE